MNDSGSSSLENYIPALDGLRFIAFTAVFVHHLPDSGLPGLRVLHVHGWAGVDLFFAISSCLFFHLLSAENRKNGFIDKTHFFIRRFLRLYPLTIFYAVAVIVVWQLAGWDIDLHNAIFRLIGLASFTDNFFAYVDGYNRMPYSAHLWTISFEFQVYLFIPLLFAWYTKLGNKNFLLVLFGIWVAAMLCRALFEWYDAPHPIVWVTPFLRPESVLVGLALSTGAFARLNFLVVALVAALATFVATKLPFVQGGPSFFAYPVVGLIAWAMVWLSLYNAWVSRMLSVPIVRYLGKISFGLYVYHVAAIGVVTVLFDWMGISVGAMNFFAFAGISLMLTIGASAISYNLLEYPFLLAKLRYSAISSRPL